MCKCQTMVLSKICCVCDTCNFLALCHCTVVDKWCVFAFWCIWIMLRRTWWFPMTCTWLTLWQCAYNIHLQLETWKFTANSRLSWEIGDFSEFPKFSWFWITSLNSPTLSQWENLMKNLWKQRIFWVPNTIPPPPHSGWLILLWYFGEFMNKVWLEHYQDPPFDCNTSVRL